MKQPKRQRNGGHDWAESFLVYKNPKVLAMLFLGFSAGLPLLLVFGTLSAWLRVEGVDKTTIGFVSWVALAYGAGGLYLLWRRIITWHVPVATLGGLLALTLPLWLLDSGAHASPLQHLAAGGLVLAAFFIATDPVSGCTSNRGRLLFGLGIAVITLVIRRWGGYPDGVAFAVLLSRRVMGGGEGAAGHPQGVDLRSATQGRNHRPDPGQVQSGLQP